MAGTSPAITASSIRLFAGTIDRRPYQVWVSAF
jgi:hypothetical protein